MRYGVLKKGERKLPFFLLAISSNNDDHFFTDK